MHRRSVVLILIGEAFFLAAPMMGQEAIALGIMAAIKSREKELNRLTTDWRIDYQSANLGTEKAWTIHQG